MYKGFLALQKPSTGLKRLSFPPALIIVTIYHSKCEGVCLPLHGLHIYCGEPDGQVHLAFGK